MIIHEVPRVFQCWFLKSDILFVTAAKLKESGKKTPSEFQLSFKNICWYNNLCQDQHVQLLALFLLTINLNIKCVIIVGRN